MITILNVNICSKAAETHKTASEIIKNVVKY